VVVAAVELYGLPVWTFWVGVAVMLLLWTLNTAARMAQSEKTINGKLDRSKHTTSPAPPRG
jgi:hypothetical protein